MIEMASENARTDAPEERRRLAELCLWLSEEEAEQHVTRCLGSCIQGGTAEAALFEKLGDCLRAYRERIG